MREQDLPKTHYELAFESLKDRSLRHAMFDVLRDDTAPFGEAPTYDDFYRSLMVAYGLSEAIEDLSDDVTFRGQLLFEINVLYHMYCMTYGGRAVYYITPGLATRLAQTNLNIDTSFLKSPHRELYVQVATGLFHIRDTTGKLVPVHGFYVNFEDTNGTKEVRVMAASILPPKEGFSFSDMTFYYRIVLGPGKTRDVVKEYTAQQIQWNQTELKAYGGEQSIEFLEDFTSFVFNVLFYLTSKNPDIIKQLPTDYRPKIEGLKSASKKRKWMQRADKATTLPVFLLGSLLLKTKDYEDIQGAGGIGKWKLTKKVYVSGYWRAQWYGSDIRHDRHSEVIWISDYAKGPDLADTIKRVQVGRAA